MPGLSWENQLLNPNFSDILCELSAAKVKFLLVGAHALAAHGLPRATGDLDILVFASEENAPRVWEALQRFGAPLHDVSVRDFAAPGVTFQMGLPPNRIDILTEISGVSFNDAWRGRITLQLGDLEIPVIGEVEFILNKKATGRPKIWQTLRP
jgi:hypothetical protein